MLFLVAPFLSIAPDPSAAATTTSIVTMPEPYITGVELILSSAIVLLIMVALQKPQGDRESLDRKAGRPRR